MNLTSVSDSSEWRGDQIANGDGWLYVLAQAEIRDLLAMAASVRTRLQGNPDNLMNLSRDDFDLGSFAPGLEKIYKRLKNGLGVSLIRGLPVADIEPLDAASIYWGIGRHLGDARPNNPEGDMLGHITDLGKTQSDPHSRGYQTREAMDYHCDQCDIVGLLCIRTAKSGGTSKIASSVAVYNELLSVNPQYAEALTEPLYWTKHGEHTADELPYYTSPVFNFLQGRLCTSFGPKHILKGHDLPDTPPLSELQREAITAAEDLADELHCAMELKVGDMQFLNNYVALHTRSAYEDHEQSHQRRLLWRLWLMNPDLRSRTNYSKQWQQGVSTGAGKARITL